VHWQAYALQSNRIAVLLYELNDFWNDTVFELSFLKILHDDFTTTGCFI